MKIAVLGSRGQLGRDLCPRLRGEVALLTRDEIDLSQPDTIAPTLGRIRPDVVVNCAAYNFVDKAESEPDPAFAVNAWGVRELAKACHQLDCLLVHFSTDYVFGLDARRSAPLDETCTPGPVSAYGLSKLAGEFVIRTYCPRHIIIRTCGLYGVWGSGGKGGNFVETMLRVAGQGKPLRVVDDQRCTPTYTADLAEVAAGLILGQSRGLFHLTNSGDCTWFEFAREIFRQAGVTASLTPITSEEFGAAARRPRYSVLRSHILPKAMRPWPDALAAYLAERTEKLSG